jgi:hypothetical protein
MSGIIADAAFQSAASWPGVSSPPTRTCASTAPQECSADDKFCSVALFWRWGDAERVFEPALRGWPGQARP